MSENNEFEGLSIVKLSDKYINLLPSGEKTEPYEQFLIYLKPNQKVVFVEENKSKYFVVDTDFLDIIHSRVHQ